MKIALIGYGKMGREIEKIAIERGHEIIAIIDMDNQGDFDSPAFLSADVAIEFTRPETAFANYLKCFERNMPVVTGTTGWLHQLDEVKGHCKQGQTFFYASNYSIGVNIFFAINKYLARIMNKFPQYNVSIEETHHVHKLDSPSGTGITLADDIVANIERMALVPIHSIREGEVTGMHEVIYESEIDVINIKHDAKNRRGFALGAVLAAEYIKDKKGFLTMDNMLDLKLK